MIIEVSKKAMFSDYNHSKLKKPKEALPLECKKVLFIEVKRLEKVLNRLNKEMI